MKEEKREGKERGKFSGFANLEKFPGYAIAKKLCGASTLAPSALASRRPPTGFLTIIRTLPRRVYRYLSLILNFYFFVIH